MKRADLSALLNSFEDLSGAQQDIVVDHLIRRALDVEAKGGMTAADQLLLVTCDMRGECRRSFFGAVGRSWLSAWQPESASA